MRVSIITGLFILFSLPIFSQQDSTKILTIERSFWSGATYKQGVKEVTKSEFETILKSSKDTLSYELYKSGKTYAILSDVTECAGGFCIGYGIASKPTNTGLLVTGCACIIVAIIIENVADAKIDESMRTYNKENIGFNLRTPMDQNKLTLFSYSINVY